MERSQHRSVQTLHEMLGPPTDELLLKIKDNGIDMDSAVPVVYIPLHEGTAPFIDMPLDFILPVRRILMFQYLQQSFHPVR